MTVSPDPSPDRLLPPDLAERARAYAVRPGSVVDPRDAATIALLRDGADGLEVYVLRRVTTMAFASGMHVFPGGTVDPRDHEHHPDWVGPEPAEWGARFGVSAAQARALVLAAVRETFEESGVLLAGAAGGLVGDTSGDDWERDRLALVDRTLSFAELLERRQLVVRADLLRAWARWMTPEFEPRRYDTAFFVAAVPGGQLTREVGGEADRVAWSRPSDLLAALSAREVTMLPPTAVVLGELAAYATVDEVLRAAAGRTITVIMPRPVVDGGPARLVLPGEPGYEP